MNVICENCGKEFNKLPSSIKRTKHNFCSKRCSNVKSNQNRWKGHISVLNNHKCIQCGKLRDYRSALCQSCRNLEHKKKCETITIKKLKQKHKNKIQSWYSSEIRNFNRVWNKHLLNFGCQICGYNNHIELCHIKPICSFNENSMLKEINDESNNVVLCPNHHWEFDNGIITINDIPKRNGGTDRT